MARMPQGANELDRLRAVQARVRSLARNHDGFGDAIRAAFTNFLALREHYQAEKSETRVRERQLARDLLVTGRLIDPVSLDNGQCMRVTIKGLCPVAVANRLRAHGRGGPLPRELERKSAAAALAALDREAIYNDPNLPEDQKAAMAGEHRAKIEAQTHVSYTWRVVVAEPGDWPQPADPRSLKTEDLQRFSESDYRTIALYRLGGLAGAGAARLIVPEPARVGDVVKDAAAHAAWRSRLPIGDDCVQHQPRLSSRAFPPDVAGQLMNDVEAWAQRAEANRATTRQMTGPHESPDHLDQSGRAAAAVDLGAIDRAAERAAAKAVEAMETRDAASIGGTYTDWKDVQGRLLAKRDRGERYTSLRKLCRELKCSDATIRKAIDGSETLKGWKARSEGPKAAPKATDLGAVARDNARQTTEPAPDDGLPDDDVDATMARLIDQAKPDERAKLNALDDAGRRALVATYQSQNLDYEPSPLKPDKPGERPRKVKQHKRA